MTDDAARAGAPAADQAGSLLCRLLTEHPEVAGIEMLGQAEIIEGTICYSLGIFLLDGRELYVDVEDAPVRAPRVPAAAAARRGGPGARARRA